MEPARKWDDLALRLGSGLVLAGGGLTLVWAGGHWFHALIAVVCGLMIWELACMVAPEIRWRAAGLGLLAALAVTVTMLLPSGLALPLLLAPALAGLTFVTTGRFGFVIFTVLILLAGFGLAHLRDDFGFVWMLWLALVVIVTDIFGYFAGRMIGGPKIWPRISPKKTWSGTVAGWVVAALVGWAFMVKTGSGVELIGISIAISMASQLGDVAESAVKRHAGVKDSSRLLPGHGGLLDRFDGMLGASILLLLVEQVIEFPPGPL